MSNLRLLLLPEPQPPHVPPQPLPFLPAPAPVAKRLSGTPFASELVATADSILRHRFPVLGTTIETGPEIHWRRDYSTGIETDKLYFRRIPFLDAARAGDHKLIWELNRHQHLVLLAQAGLLTGEESYFQAIREQLESWFAANPFQRGINWSSALEVAFRALSWIWLYHLAGSRLPKKFLDRLYWHGCHLEVNLSHYFSPNTHLLGEAVALHALGRLFGMNNWERTGARVVDRQMDLQVHDDGSHFEQSSYYHVYALDMFLFHAVLRPEVPHWSPKLKRMAEYLRALLGRGRTLAYLGDDDGGRFFHPYGPPDEFGCATLATCAVFLNRPDLWAEPEDLFPQAAWWLGLTALDRHPGATAPPELKSRLFSGAGVAVMTAGSSQIIADAGSFGPWGSGHSHSDTLSVVVRKGSEEILVDAGTYTYVGGARDWFRGSSAHNTVRIGGRDQAAPAGPFGWTGQPKVRIRTWTTSEQRDFLDAECHYAGFVHRRRILLIKPDVLLVVDDVAGPPGEHRLEQYWHSSAVGALSSSSFRLGSGSVLFLDGQAELEEGGENGWRSRAFGRRFPAPVIRVARRCRLPSRFAAGLILGGQGDLQMTPPTAEFRWRTETSEQVYRMPEDNETPHS
jgi:hypothetical protein